MNDLSIKEIVGLFQTPIKLIDSNTQENILQKCRESHDFCVDIIKAIPLITTSDAEYVAKIKAALFFQIDPAKIEDGDTLQKVSELSRIIRNLGLISEAKDKDFVEFIPAQEKLVRNILYFDSLYFQTLFSCSMRESAPGFNAIEFEETDIEEQKIVLSYVRKNDAERKAFADSLTLETACQIINLSTRWHIDELIEAIDRVIVAQGSLDKEAVDNFGGLDLFLFPKIKTWLFLCLLFSPDKPYDDEVQEKARKYITEPSGEGIKRALNVEWIEFLLNTPIVDCPAIDFSIESLEVNSGNLESLFNIGKKFRSPAILLKCLEFEAAALKIETKRPGEKEYSTGGYHSDNYLSDEDSDDEHRDSTENHHNQKEFRFAPYPTEDIKLFLFPENVDLSLFDLLTKYSFIAMGLTIKLSQIDQFLIFSQKFKLDSVKLLGLNFDIEAIPDIQNIRNAISLFKNLKIVVIPEALQKRAGVPLSKGLAKELSFWKTIHGKVNMIKGGVHKPYDAYWEKVPDSY